MNDLAGIIVLGLAAGSVYGLAATGLVLTFTTSGIFNFAHGAVAAIGAYTFYEVSQQGGVHWLPALVGCTFGVGVVCGLVLERMARRLAAAPLHLRVVATVGLILVVEGLVEARYGTTTLYADRFLPSGTVTVLGAQVGVDRMLLVAFGALSVLAVRLLLRRTRTGLAMRAVVDEPGLLAETGTDPVAVRRLSWVLGASLAAASGILLAPSVGLEPVVLTFLVVQAFGAAAIGRFASPLATYGGGLAIGVVVALTTRYVGDVAGLSGLPSSIPFLVLLAVLLTAPPGQLAGDERGRRPRRPRRALPVPAFVGLALLAAATVASIPTLAGPRLPIFTNGAALMLVFVSLAVLVNGSGQISLCHAAFAAVGAATFAHLTSGAGLPWALALPMCGLATVPLAVAVAIPAARLSGLALAVATFGLGIVVDRLLSGSGVMFGTAGTRLVPRPEFGGLDSDRGYFFLVAGLAIVTTAAVAQMLRGRTGRLLAALADDPKALASTGASVTVARVVVFSLSAFLAGVGGALAAAGNGSATSVSHPPMQSLLWVAVLAIGGRGPIVAGVRAAAGFALVPVYLEWLIGTHVSLAFGIGALVMALGRSGSRARPRTSAPCRLVLVASRAWSGPIPTRHRGGCTMKALEVHELVVRHGGVTAVDHVSLHVESGAIAGLIGPNGAGKTSLLDACCGLVPSAGTVTVAGRPVDGLGHAARARIGLGRTFQRPALFDSLTVADNVGLGWEGPRAGAHPNRHVFARRGDAAARAARLGEAMRLCGIAHLAALPAGRLTTGQRRLAELARVLAGDFAVLLLDEPGAGLDDPEKRALAGVLRSVQQTNRVALLLVEHDLRLVTELCSELFVLDAGTLIFAGSPDAAMRDDAVRRAYLGAGVA